MNYRDLAAGPQEKEDAKECLYNILFTGTNDDGMGIWLQRYMGQRAPGAEKIIAAEISEGSSELPYRELPGVLVDMLGSEIFEGVMGYQLRDKILERLLQRKEYRKIFGIFLAASSRHEDERRKIRAEFKMNEKSQAHMYAMQLKDHKKYPWRPGKSYAMGFVKEIGVDDVFAGIPSEPPSSRKEEAVPKADLRKLASFQMNMKKQILAMLAGTCGNRAIVALPTGAGKTRIVVEAIVDFLNDKGTDRNILWIAQSQEVCEQAVLCFKQIWEHRGRGETLDIFRAWGKNDLPSADEHGIIVGGEKKLLARRNELDGITEGYKLSAVFIDEAHHSVAESYTRILEGLRMSPSPDGALANDGIPLIGLTATPERAREHETERLRSMYGGKRIFPSELFQPDSDTGIRFDHNWQDLGFVSKNLTELRYLAECEFHPIDPGRRVVRLTPEETRDLEDGGDRWMMKIATEAERNRRIKDEILKWTRKNKKILYFGTNVAQSNAMARILEKEGVNSVCITADTRYATRKMLVDTFNDDNGGIQVMCNYNVLATGFDSPRIDTVIIARPTTSVVSYHQMVGRGLRGKKFGGNEGNRCDIVTVRDNILKFNSEQVELGYRKFERDRQESLASKKHS